MHDNDIAPLTPADEGLNHQIADTFAAVVESDRGWTEKIWASLARKDGSLQIDFGLGKYLNRNVMDGFGGVSRGGEQWTVRASRALSPEIDQTAVGPIRYEIIEPLKKVRFVLEKNATQPIAFDVLFEAELPPYFEKRNRMRAGHRIGMNVVRYHQPGRLSGWIEVDSERHVVDDQWFGFRDHSWGMRGDGIGAVPGDLMPNVAVPKNMRMLWGPWLMQQPDGSRYEVMNFLWSTDNWEYYSGAINHPDGKQQQVRRMTPHLRFDTTTRFLLGGHLELLMDSGETRRIEVTPVGSAGFHLRTAEYGAWQGHRHGQWRGAYHEDGEYIPDCAAAIKDIGQLRDRPVRLREGDATGYGIVETVWLGLFPELGLDAASDVPVGM